MQRLDATSMERGKELSDVELIARREGTTENMWIELQNRNKLNAGPVVTSMSCKSLVKEYIFSFFADLLLGPLADGGKAIIAVCSLILFTSFRGSWFCHWYEEKAVKVEAKRSEAQNSQVRWFSIVHGQMPSLSQSHKGLACFVFVSKIS